MDYYDIEWFALETNRDHSVVFEVTSKYCISDSFVDHDGYCKKAKWLSEQALQIAEKRREAQGKGEKERYTHLNAEFQRILRRDKKAFLS